MASVETASRLTEGLFKEVEQIVEGYQPPAIELQPKKRNTTDAMFDLAMLGASRVLWHGNLTDHLAHAIDEGYKAERAPDIGQDMLDIFSATL